MKHKPLDKKATRVRSGKWWGVIWEVQCNGGDVLQMLRGASPFGKSEAISMAAKLKRALPAKDRPNVFVAELDLVKR